MLEGGARGEVAEVAEVAAALCELLALGLWGSEQVSLQTAFQDLPDGVRQEVAKVAAVPCKSWAV